MRRKSLVPGFDDGAVFRSLFAAYPDALLLVDLQGVIGLANPAALELLGYSEDELRGLSVDELVPDAIRPRHAAYTPRSSTRRTGLGAYSPSSGTGAFCPPDG